MTAGVGSSVSIQQVTHAVISQILRQICISESIMSEERDVEVRFMASGARACCIRASPGMTIARVKDQVCEHAGIPPEEQRLFTKGSELEGEAPVLEHDFLELTLVRSISDLRVSDLSHFHSLAPVEIPVLPLGAFREVCKITKGIHGDIFKYRWNSDHGEEIVAVKRLRTKDVQQVRGTETDERCIHLESKRGANRCSEDALTEIGVLSYLSRQPDLPGCLLKLLGVFRLGPFTWLVTEFADGGELFNVVASRGLSPAEVKRYILQILEAVAYLHRHYIGHRDISLENVLLRNGSAKLMDFGMAVRSHTASGSPLRFFRSVGKSFYRAPECYVPQVPELKVVAPPGSAPGDIVLAKVQLRDTFLCEARLPERVSPGSLCVAETWGYAAQPADMFAVGVCMFILAFQCPPWREARLSDPYFAVVHSSGVQAGIEKHLKQWKKAETLCSEAMQMLISLLSIEPAVRPSATDCLKEKPWLAQSVTSDACPQQVPARKLQQVACELGGA